MGSDPTVFAQKRFFQDMETFSFYPTMILVQVGGIARFILALSY